MKKYARRFIHDKRAITPVLSHLLLTVVAVAIMSIATTATFLITTNLRENMSERVVIEDVWFNSETRTVEVYLRNVGKTAIEISVVYVNHVGQTFSSPFRLEIKKHGSLIIFYNWAIDEIFHIDIVTSRGTHIAGSYKAS